MLQNYFKIACRNLLKKKLYSLVNIAGLAIGMAACFFVFQYVHFEKSYDQFNTNAASIYRVNISYSGSFANLPMTATNHPPVGPAMKAEFPEVLGYARLVAPSLFMNATTLSFTNTVLHTTSFNEQKIFIADPGFLALFSYPLSAGDPASALSAPNSILLSKTTAKKYFGKEDPMGKTLYLNQKSPLKVTGVFKDVPENSHIKFDMLVSFSTMDNNNQISGNWTWPEFYNYVLLAPGTDPKKLSAKFPAFIERHLGTVLKSLNFGCAFHLQPVTDIHLKSHYLKEPEVSGSENEISFLSIIGILILAIAWINYINLSTAKSMERAKEVGLRKVMGSSRLQLIGQFIMESAVLNACALLLAFLIVVCCFPFFGNFTGKQMANGSYGSELWHTAGFWPALAGILLTGAFVVGAYPAFVLSGFRPVLVLKGAFNRSAKGILLRKTLVSFQFILSILLIGGAITVSRQLYFMRNQALGYNKDEVIVIKAPAFVDSTYLNKFHLFQSALSRNPAIKAVTASSDIPGRTIIERNTIRKAGDDASKNFITYLMHIDEHFVETYHMKMAAGRSFNAMDTMSMYKPKTDYAKVIINESLARGLGFTSNEAALHEKLDFGIPCEIIGVLKDYHQRSLKEVYDPIFYYYPAKSNDWAYVSININMQHPDNNITSVETLYKAIFPGHPFDYFFLNDYFNQQYKADQQFGKVFSAFTILAIFVACLGLLGLSGFAISLRKKEIGIRKVLGATVPGIIVLFAKDFAKLVGLASIIAIPMIYFMADRWLMNYAFHSHVNWFNLLLPPVLLLVITLLTVAMQSIKTAVANPVKSLRTE